MFPDEIWKNVSTTGFILFIIDKINLFKFILNLKLWV